MTTKPSIKKTSARFMRTADRLAIARVNQAVPVSLQAAQVSPALAARIKAIRRNIGIASDNAEPEAVPPSI